jgi:putative transposase
MINVRTTLYHGHRFAAEIIAEAVWLYFRFPLSFRMAERHRTHLSTGNS